MKAQLNRRVTELEREQEHSLWTFQVIIVNRDPATREIVSLTSQDGLYIAGDEAEQWLRDNPPYLDLTPNAYRPPGV